MIFINKLKLFQTLIKIKLVPRVTIYIRTRVTTKWYFMHCFTLRCTALLHHERRLRSQLSMSQVLCLQCWYIGTLHFSCCSIYCMCHTMMFRTQWAPSMRRNELLLEMTWEVTTTVLSMTLRHMASDETAEWRRELFDVVLTDSLDRQSCVMSAPWYLLWCRLRHYVDEDDDELSYPWRRDDVVSCLLDIKGQLASSVLYDECASSCTMSAPVPWVRNGPAFRFSTSLRRWPMRSLWKDAVLWQHADWSIYMVGKLNWNGSCRVC